MIPNNVSVPKVAQGWASQKEQCWATHIHFPFRVIFLDSFLPTKGVFSKIVGKKK